MLKEKSIFQTRTFSIIMVATVAALAMVAIFFLTRTLTTAKPAALRIGAPSVLKAEEPQVVAGAIQSAESQSRARSASAYAQMLASTNRVSVALPALTRAQMAEAARWNGLAGLQANLSGGMTRAQLAEIARWNGLAGQQANLSGGMTRAQLAEIARWNGLAEQEK